jgi:two-component system NtrC family sensor kinase
LAESSQRMIIYTVCALLLIAVLTWSLVWQVVARPVKALRQGTERLAQGDLGYQLEVESHDEIGELARSFNAMSAQLKSEHTENITWTHTLEERVDQKTRELKRAHEHALHTEKMASIGKMAAVLAHEINNPLSGILTYAKLLRKWINSDDGGKSRQRDICDSLELIAAESRRCGDLVKSLLTFSRTTPMNMQRTSLNRVIEQALRLIRHQLDLANVQVQLQVDPSLPDVICDGAQIEQVLLALMMNALDAMPQGGNLWVNMTLQPDENVVRIVVRDDGTGIAAEILPRLFEPFLTTKETGKGVGLGLAISRSILERHSGKIEVQSELGRGTTFTIILPCEAEDQNHLPVPQIAAAVSGR